MNKKVKSTKPRRKTYPGRIQYTENGKYGKYSRADGPALVYASGSEYWVKGGKKHREDGPAQIDDGGNEWWYYNNQLHREDGPAVTLVGVGEWPGKKFYCYRGIVYRTKKAWSEAVKRYKERGQKKRAGS